MLPLQYVPSPCCRCRPLKVVEQQIHKEVVFIEAPVGGKEALNLEVNHFPDQVDVIVSAFTTRMYSSWCSSYTLKTDNFHGLGICLRLRKRYNIILADLNLRKRRYQNLFLSTSVTQSSTREIFLIP